MERVQYEDLVAALPKLQNRPTEGSPLKVSSQRPTAFVPPVLLSTRDNCNVSGAAVIIIDAPAAVGKSTLTAALSADHQLPVLDLSAVPVGMGSLRGCITDLGPDAEANFRGGRVAILVDALDEGRLLSNEAGFRAFCESAAPLLVGAVRPQLVLLGRTESAQKAETYLRDSDPTVRITRLQLGFFDEDGARALIREYAKSTAAAEPHECGAYIRNPQQGDLVIDAYFAAIESALGITAGELWNNDEGRSLAGYAPVLAALGGLLPKLGNFFAVTQELRREGHSRAWAVIEDVIAQILTREKDKQRKGFAENQAVQENTLPGSFYDENEQLALVVQHVHGKPLLGCRQLRFDNRHLQQAYEQMVETKVKEHPFVHDGHFRNQVLASIAIAAALHRSDVDDIEADGLAEYSHHPFLWRSFERRGFDGGFIYGYTVGYLLDSFWNDPLRKDASEITIRARGEDVVITVNGLSGELVALPPVMFFGQLRNVDLDLPKNEIRFVGRSLRSQATSFRIEGTAGVAVTCETMDFRTQTLFAAGEIWLDAAVLVQSPDQIRTEPNCQVGWGGALKDRRPFRDHESTVDDPRQRAAQPGLHGMLAECARRKTPTAVVVAEDFGIPDGQRSGPLVWLQAMYADDWRRLLNSLVEHSLAVARPIQARGANTKMRFSLQGTSWESLVEASRRLQLGSVATTAEERAIEKAREK